VGVRGTAPPPAPAVVEPETAPCIGANCVVTVTLAGDREPVCWDCRIERANGHEPSFWRAGTHMRARKVHLEIEALLADYVETLVQRGCPRDDAVDEVAQAAGRHCARRIGDMFHVGHEAEGGKRR